MKRFSVRHLMLCEVSVWRTIEANTFEEALERTKLIDTVTATESGADYEIVHDVGIKELTIKELA